MKPYILTNAHILPLTDACLGFAKADSILVQDKIISAIGDMSQCRQAAKSTAEVIDLDGRVLLPAFCDSHTHFAELAKRRFQLNLSGCTQVRQIQDAAIRFREMNDPLPKWVLGDGWDANLLDHPQMLDRTMLDQLFPDVPAVLARCNELTNVQVRGLMTIPPLTEDPEKARPHFRALRELRDRWAAELGMDLDELSMGMTHDLEAAIGEGATIVRVGTAIFGERARPAKGAEPA